MPMPPGASNKSGRNLFRRGVGLGAGLFLAAIVAAALTTALDHYATLGKRRANTPLWDGVRPGMIPSPTADIWQPAPLPQGSAAPEFTLMDVQTGAEVSLSDYRGRPVVLLLSSFG